MIQIQNYTQIRGGWTIGWNSTGATSYRIVLWGITLATITSNTYTWTGQNYVSFPPPLEVVPADELALSETYLPYLIMQWYGEPEAAVYQVQQYIASSWQTLAKVQETGLWIYTFQTLTLLDGNLYNYQIIAVDSVGNLSIPRQYRRNVVCPPVPPDGIIRISYTKPNLVVSAV